MAKVSMKVDGVVYEDEVPPRRLLVHHLRDGLEVQPGGDGVLVVPGATPEHIGALAAAGRHVVIDLRPLEHGPEDVFFSLTNAS